MANNNKRKRDDHDTGETGVGAFTGDTMASALDPFGSTAAGVSDRESGNKAEKGTDDDKMTAPKREL